MATPASLKIDFERAKLEMLKANTVCIISHRKPDGDAVGSNVALRLALENLGKKVVSASVDPVPEDSLFLEKADTFVQDFNPDNFDLIISVDCAARKMVAFGNHLPQIFDGRPFVNIDHHESNDNYGTINIVDPKACSTAILLYQFFTYSDWFIDIEMATALLHGIYFDTGSLMHSNTTEEVYTVAGELMAKGANLKKIVKKLFHTRSVNKLRLWGRALEKASINDENVVVSALSKDDYKATGSNPNDTGGVIDYLNSIPNTKYSVLLSEDDKGLVKGSLRTQREDVNLSEIASQWGGGGHPKASGFGLEGKLKPVTSWQIVEEDPDNNLKVKGKF